MTTSTDELSSLIQSSANRFATDITEFSERDESTQTAVIKLAVRDVAWALLEEFPDEGGEISDMLSLMSDRIKKKEQDYENAED